MNKNFRINVFEKASLSRHFEEQVILNTKIKNIKIPVYVSAGQEFISSTISTICKMKKIKPLIFGQHRCHSIYIIYLSFKFLNGIIPYIFLLFTTSIRLN